MAYLTYDVCEKLFATARSPDKGKPLTKQRSTLRLHKDEQGFFLTYYGDTFARVSSDNVLHILQKPAISRGYYLSKCFGVIAAYIGRRRYRVFCTNDSSRPRWNNMRYEDYRAAYRAWITAQSQWHEDMKFDLIGRKVMNPIPDPSSLPLNRERNSEWRKLVKEFKEFWHVSTAVGAFNIAENLLTNGGRFCPDRFIAMMQTKEVTEQDLCALVYESGGRWYYYWNKSDPNKLQEHTRDLFKRVYARHRPELRVKFGCYAQ